jgi:hypothetical protein
MARDFWDGFSGSFFQQAQIAVQNERNRERDERERQRFGWEKERAEREQNAARQYGAIQDAAQHGDINAESAAQGTNLTPAQVRGGAGIGVLDVNATDPANADMRTAPISRGEAMRRTGKVKLGLGDTAGFAAAETAAKGFEWDDTVKKAIADFDKDPDGAGSSLMKNVNLNTKTFAAEPLVVNGKTTGYRTLVIKEDGTAVSKTISPAQMRTLAAAQAGLEVDPMKALEMFRSVDKDIAEAVARENQLTAGATQAHNQATNYANQDSRDRIRLGMQQQDRRRLDEQLQLGRQAAGLYEGVVAARNAGPAGREAGAIYSQQLAGINARLQALGMPGVGVRDPRTEMTPVQRAQAIKSLVDSGMSLPQAQIFLDTGGNPAGALDAAFGASPGQPTAPQGSQPARTQDQPPRSFSSGQRTFGMLTPRSVLEAELAAGNPAAIAYVQRMNAARADDESYRGAPGFGGQ